MAIHFHAATYVLVFKQLHLTTVSLNVEYISKTICYIHLNCFVPS